jgi:MFS family permease
MTMSLAYRRYGLAVMTAVYTLNLVDRGLIHLLLQPIKVDLQLSDTQLGFLTGMAFALFYATAGVPIARWADRGNRATIAALAIGVWGLTVMMCVFVVNYVQLVLARVAAGVGEAGCKPPTYSLIGDYFPEAAARTRAMSIYWLGNPIATLISFALGGWLAEMYGWRMTFLLMGIPGLLLAVIVKLTIVDPRVNAPSAVPAPAASMKSVLSLIWRQRSSRHLCLALILLYTMGSGLNPWYAAFMIRSHGMGTAELGLWLGIVFCIGGFLGILSGGFLSARLFAESERSQMRMSAFTVAAFVPCLIAFVTLPEKAHALLALLPMIAAFSFFMGPTYALLQRLVPDNMRATVLAVVLLLVNLIGMGLGPQVVGALSDVLSPSYGPDGLRISMLLMSLVALWSSYHFWQAGKTVEGDLSSIRTAQAW